MIRLDFDCIWIRSYYLVIKYCLSLYLTQLQCFLCPGSFIHFAVLIYLDFCIQLQYCPVPIALYYASVMCSLGYMQYSNENWITMKHYEIYSYSEQFLILKLVYSLKINIAINIPRILNLSNNNHYQHVKHKIEECMHQDLNYQPITMFIV